MGPGDKLQKQQKGPRSFGERETRKYTWGGVGGKVQVCSIDRASLFLSLYRPLLCSHGRRPGNGSRLQVTLAQVHCERPQRRAHLKSITVLCTGIKTYLIVAHTCVSCSMVNLPASRAGPGLALEPRS